MCSGLCKSDSGACGNRNKKLPGTDGAGFEKNKDFNLIAEDILKVKAAVKSVCK